MDLNKVLGEKELTVELADTGLKSENGLVSGHSQIDDSVVQSGVEANHGHLVLAFLLAMMVVVFLGLVQNLSACIFQLEWKDRC